MPNNNSYGINVNVNFNGVSYNAGTNTWTGQPSWNVNPNLLPVTPGSDRGMPGRRASSPTPTVWKQIVGMVRSGDITGGLAGSSTPQSRTSAPSPVSPAPAPTNR